MRGWQSQLVLGSRWVPRRLGEVPRGRKAVPGRPRRPEQAPPRYFLGTLRRARELHLVYEFTHGTAFGCADGSRIALSGLDGCCGDRERRRRAEKVPSGAPMGPNKHSLGTVLVLRSRDWGLHLVYEFTYGTAFGCADGSRIALCPLGGCCGVRERRRGVEKEVLGAPRGPNKRRLGTC